MTCRPSSSWSKHYPSGSVIEVRTITKPVAGTVKVYLDSVEQLSGWPVDTTTGLVTFGTAPSLGLRFRIINAVPERHTRYLLALYRVPTFWPYWVYFDLHAEPLY
jgi:hypothetical protein